MLKAIRMWAPIVVLASIGLDMYINWNDPGYRMIAITAALGWLFFWDALRNERSDSDG